MKMKRFLGAVLLLTAVLMPASSGAQTLPPGCTSTSGYSPTTGEKCDRYSGDGSLPPGCTSTEGYSPITGERCDSRVNDLEPVGVNVTSAVLSLQYAEGQKGALAAKFKGTIVPKVDDVIISKKGQFGVVAENTKGQNAMWNGIAFTITPEPGSVLCGYEQSNECYRLNEGTTYTFTFDVSFNPRQSFGGVYTAFIDSFWYYTGGNGEGTSITVTPKVVSNSIAIVGEISPYISSVKWSDGRSYVIFGGRLAGGSILIDGKSGLVSNDKLNNDGTRSFVLSSTVPSGNHNLQIKNSNVGDSNFFYFNVGGSTNFSEPTITDPGTGTVWIKGKNYPISWSGNTKNDDLQFYLIKKDGSIGAGILAVDDAEESGTIYYTPTDASTWQGKLPAGKDYVARVHVAGNPKYFETKQFTIKNATDEPPAGMTVKLTSPNGDDVWPVGTRQKISWTTTGYPSTAKIQLGMYDTRYSTEAGPYPEYLIVNTTNTGSYTWNIPDELKADYDNAGVGHHKVTIYVGDGGNQGVNYDQSDKPFALTSDTMATDTPSAVAIKVISPNGGEGFTAGQKMPIIWEATGLDKVRITVRKGGVLKSTIVSSTDNDGDFTWTIPNNFSAGSDYQIRVRDAMVEGTPKYFDDSDGKFSISTAGVGFLQGDGFVASVVEAITGLFSGN